MAQTSMPTINIDQDKLARINERVDRITQRVSTKISPPTPSTAPQLTAGQRRIIQRLGFTPKETPMIRSEEPDSNITTQLFDLLGRFESFGAGAVSGFAEAIQTGFREAQKTQNPLEAVKGLAYAFTGIPALQRAIEGGFGDVRYTGGTLTSQILDDPQIREGFKGTAAEQVIDSPVFRIAADLIVGTVVDPTSVAPVNAILGVGSDIVNRIGRIAGAGDDIVGSTISAIKKTKPAKFVAETLSSTANRLPAFVTRNQQRQLNEAFGAGISGGFNKLLSGTANADEISDLVTRIGTRIPKTKAGKALFNQIKNNVDEAFEVAQRLGPEAIDQQKLFQQIAGVVQEGNKAFDADLQKIAEPVRQVIDDVLTPQLVGLGLITPEQQAAGFGSYIRLIYQKLGIPEDEIKVLGSKAASGGARIGTEAGALQRRLTDVERFLELPADQLGNVNPAAFEALQRDFRALSSEVGAADAAKQLAVQAAQVAGGADQLKQLANLRRQSRGLIEEAALIAPETIEQQIRLIERYSFLDWASNTIASDDFAEGLKRIPDTKAFGNLAGKYVPETMANDIVGMFGQKSDFQKALQKATSIWKEVKLFGFLNTATNMRNFVSNMVLNNVIEDGIPFHRIDVYLDAMKEIEKRGDFYKKALAAGLFESGYASQEVRRGISAIEPDLLDKARKLITEPLPEKIAGRQVPDVLRKAFSTEGVQLFGPIGYGKAAFENTENVGKLAQFIWQTNKGKTAEEAARLANKALFDYTQLPQRLRSVRDVAVPFLSFKYFAAQLAADTFLNRTSKLSRLPKTKRAIEDTFAEATQLQGGRRTEVNELPEYMRENRALLLQTPFLDQRGNPKFIDLTYLFPFGGVAGGFEPKDFIPPLAAPLLEQNLNRNLFFDTPITRPGQSPVEQATARAQALIQSYGPTSPVLPGTYQFNKLIDAIAQRPDRYGRNIEPVSAFADIFGGFKFRDVDPGEQTQLNREQAQREIADLQSEVSRVRNDERLSDTDRQSRIADLTDRIRERRRALVLTGL